MTFTNRDLNSEDQLRNRRVLNVKLCDYCHGPVDREGQFLQCRNQDCGAYGDAFTGILCPPEK
jgi:hypothetical protein